MNETEFNKRLQEELNNAFSMERVWAEYQLANATYTAHPTAKNKAVLEEVKSFYPYCFRYQVKKAREARK